jgi:hypothetical protein
MALLYNRAFKLTVFSKPETSWEVSKAAQRSIAAKSVTVDSLVITDLKVVAKIDKTNKDSTPSAGNLSLYNINDQLKAALMAPSAMVVFDAGYSTQPNLPTLISGNVKSVVTTRQGEDTVTEVEVGDGYTPYITDTVSMNFPKGTRKADVFRQLGASFTGLAFGEVRSAPDSFKRDVYDAPMAVAGRLSVVMDELCAAEGFLWYMEDGKVYVQPTFYVPSNINVGEGTVLKNPTAFDTVRTYTITEDLVKGSLKPSIDATEKGEKKTRKGVTFTTFLDGRIKLNSYLNVKVENAEGLYRVEKVSHSVDTRGQSWDTKVEAAVV